MNKNLILTLVIATTLGLILAAGCSGTTSNSGTCPAPAPQAGPQIYTAVNINATPIQYKEVNGVKLAYREFGSGEPVLMIPGFGNNMDGWNETFIGILASKYHVFIYDPRGMGSSSDTNKTPVFSQYSDDAAALIKALGYDSMHVYGVSMGSSTAQQLVIDHPERVKKLVLDSVTYNIRLPETKLLLALNEEVNASPSQPAGTRHEAQANLEWKGSWDKLSGIQKDVMLVEGTADILTPDPISVRMAGQINGSWVVRFKGLPHVGSKYAPVQYGENALDFLGMNESPLSK
ncbi:alpha/beta hydrolase [uncultured Methanoregula sp.]|uniref:alpha/beta fold hydrolase n=1 Tax=uncultured Methanoregula sp. TaxID=1005933 RepID=UPI002AAB1350|nr:alpha/beta hydrolase [uncultured Methanoregula sp.]